MESLSAHHAARGFGEKKRLTCCRAKGSTEVRSMARVGNCQALDANATRFHRDSTYNRSAKLHNCLECFVEALIAI